MRTRLSAGLHLALWTSTLMSAGQLPGTLRVVSSAGYGQTISGNLEGSSSATASMRWLLHSLGQYFDRGLAVQGGFRDHGDQQVEAFFKTLWHGVPVTGFAVVASIQGRAQAGVVFDRSDMFPRTFSQLFRQVGGGSGGGAAQPAQPLRQTMLPDGSGSIGLPPGWQITGAFKGTVDLVGPGDQQASLGGYMLVSVPGAIRAQMVGPYRDPVTTLQLYIDHLTQGGLSRRQVSFRLIEQAPVPWQNGLGAYISYEVGMAGKHGRGLALVGMAPIDQTSWMLYLSYVAAPTDRFPQAFPTLWAMWRSWKISGWVFTERMEAALRSMRETWDILQSVNANRSRAYENANYAWDQVIRGVTTIEDTVTRARGEVDTTIVDRLVRRLNEQGYQYRIVPLPELVQ